MCVRPLYYAPMCECSSAEKRWRRCFVSWSVAGNSLGHCITPSSPPFINPATSLPAVGGSQCKGLGQSCWCNGCNDLRCRDVQIERPCCVYHCTCTDARKRCLVGVYGRRKKWGTPYNKMRRASQAKNIAWLASL